MISARTSVVQKAVAIIDPDEHRRVDCMNAVHLALTGVVRSAEDLPRLFHHRTKRAKRAAARLEKAFDRWLKALDDSDLNQDLRPGGRWPKRKRLVAWRRQVAAARNQSGPPLRLDIGIKISAAERAYMLLRNFNRKITVAPGSPFCELAALLCGKPKASLYYACRKVVERWGNG